MNRVRGRAVAVVAGACLAATLVAVPSAQAAVTASRIDVPTDLTYRVYDNAPHSPNTLYLRGTSNGTIGDQVDLLCYAGDLLSYVAHDVPLNGDGSFTVDQGDLRWANNFRVCNLRAVPAGTTPAPTSAYKGPRLLVGYKDSKIISGGPNDGKLRDYYLYFQQLAGGNDYDSIGGCGIDDGYLLHNNSLATVTWDCNAALFNSDADIATRSDIQIDGADAYTPAGANVINSGATAGFPALKYAYKVNPHTGDARITETDGFVKCPSTTFPPTNVSCPTFASAGVRDTRTILQTRNGTVTWITDVFTSTDGHAHKLNLLWANNERFHHSTGDSTKLEFKFPGQKGYAMHVANDSVGLPASAPAAIFIRMHGAADGDPSTGQGAIVYDRPATAAKFASVSSDYEGVTLHQTATVPAHGSVRFRFAYVEDFHAAEVASLAKQAVTVFRGCTVPNVVGKSLAAARKAITAAHCAVGRVTHVHSTAAPAGSVVSQKPKAKTKVDFGTKVALTVSRG